MTSSIREFRPGTFIAAGQQWTLVLNDNQNLLGKCMLFLNRDETDVTQATSEEWLALRANLASVRAALTRLFQPDQFNFAFLMNAEAQVHLHIVPRYKSPRTWEAETFVDPQFGSLFDMRQHVLDSDRLDLMSAAIRADLATPIA